MSILLFSNNANSTLAGSITAVATTANLAAGTGTLFPNPSAGEIFIGSFFDAATGLQTEIVHVTGIVGDQITMTRAQEGTAAQSWNVGDIFANQWTAGSAAAMLQQAQAEPVTIITASGAFITTSNDGSFGLARVSALAASTTTLPSDAADGQVFTYEDLIGNFNAYPLTISAPAGMNIAGESSWKCNANRGSWSFRFYGSNTYGVRFA